MRKFQIKFSISHLIHCISYETILCSSSIKYILAELQIICFWWVQEWVFSIQTSAQNHSHHPSLHPFVLQQDNQEQQNRVRAVDIHMLPLTPRLASSRVSPRFTSRASNWLHRTIAISRGSPVVSSETVSSCHVRANPDAQINVYYAGEEEAHTLMLMLMQGQRAHSFDFDHYAAIADVVSSCGDEQRSQWSVRLPVLFWCCDLGR